MLASASGLDLLGLLVLATGMALLGLVLLLGRASVSRPWRVALFLVAGLATLMPFLDNLAVARRPLLGLAALCATCPLLSTAYPRRLLSAAVALVGQCRAQGAALLAASLSLLVGLPVLLEREAAGARQAQGEFADHPVSAHHKPKPVTAWTDRGSPVTAFDLGAHLPLVDEQAAEAQLMQARNLGLRLIRTAPPDGGCNCHGWVYTGGRYLVSAGDVDHILNDNGYEAVTTPQVGDLVVYRAKGGVPAHSAVVRVATDDGLVLLEGKWNTLGVYLHAPEDYAPGLTWTYYRSPRSGHVLRGLDPHDPAPGACPAGEQTSPPGR
jgi:hypothetical protein